MPEDPQYPQEGQTMFYETPRLNPSSLAFFISEFKESLRETSSGTKHLVSVRESEMDYTEKLFDMTALIVPAVESFMRVSLPNEILHSVAIPNFGHEAGSFYGFNYYR